MKKYILTFLMFASLCFVYGGDVAAYEDIGFSPDGKTYIYGQYGITDKSFQGYAEIYCVDVEKNDFIPKGVFKTNPSLDTTGKSGFSVYNLLKEKNTNYINSFKPSPVTINDILYLKPNDSKSSTEPIVVTDFEHTTQENPITYKFSLVPFVEGKGNNLVSSFYIIVEKMDKDGKLIEKLVAGTPDIKRKMILSYSIEKIMCSPDGKNFVMVVEKRSEEDGVPSIRYMVETFTFKK